MSAVSLVMVLEKQQVASPAATQHSDNFAVYYQTGLPSIVVPSSWRRSYEAFAATLTTTQKERLLVSYTQKYRQPHWYDGRPVLGLRPIEELDDTDSAVTPPPTLKQWQKWCLRRPPPPLYRHQLASTAQVKHQDWYDERKGQVPWRFILNWGMGSGKTRGSLELVMGGIQRAHDVVILCAKTFMHQWSDAISHLVLEHVDLTDEYKLQRAETYFTLMSYEQAKAPEMQKSIYLAPQIRSKVVIVDEFHFFKNANQAAWSCMWTLQQQTYLILVSGTLFPNSREDALGILFLMNSLSLEELQQVKISTHKENEKRQLINTLCSDMQLRKSLKDRISVFDPKWDATQDLAQHYPQVTREVVAIPLPLPAFLDYMLNRKYLAIPVGAKATASNWIQIPIPGANASQKSQLSNIYKFYEENPAENPKFAYILQNWSRWDLPLVIHSEYVQASLQPLQDLILEHQPHLLCRIIEGGTPDAERRTILRAFNQGKVAVLLISKAAATGVDLKGGRTIIRMDVGDNLESEAQSIARIIRMRSHSHLPETDRKVAVIRLLLTPPPELQKAATAWSPEDRKEVVELYETYGPSKKAARDLVARLAAEPTLAVEWLCADFHTHQDGLLPEQTRYAQNQEKQKEVDHLQQLLRDITIPMPKDTMSSLAQKPALQKELQKKGLYYVDTLETQLDVVTPVSEAIEKARKQYVKQLLDDYVKTLWTGPPAPVWSYEKIYQWCLKQPQYFLVSQAAAWRHIAQQEPPLSWQVTELKDWPTIYKTHLPKVHTTGQTFSQWKKVQLKKNTRVKPPRKPREKKEKQPEKTKKPRKPRQPQIKVLSTAVLTQEAQR